MTAPVVVYVPKETASDEHVLLVSWGKESGAAIEEGELLASVETSKAAIEIEAPASGYVFHSHAVGAEIRVGEILAVIAPTREFDLSRFLEAAGKPEAGEARSVSGGPEGVRFSQEAAELIAEGGIDPGVFEGMKFVRRRDVLARSREASSAAATNAPGPTVPRGVPAETAIIIVGAGGHAKMCIDILRQRGEFEIVGLIGSLDEVGKELMGISVIGTDEDLPRIFDQGVHYAVNGVGWVTAHRQRRRLFERIKAAGFTLPNIIHPSAVVEPSAFLGEGNQVMAQALVGSAAVLQDNCIVNSGAIVSHDCVLEDNVHVAPSCTLGGNVRVGADSLIGMGVTVYFGVNIGRRTVVRNGVSVFKDVPPDAMIRS